MRFYAVVRGKNPGIYNKWNRCKKQITQCIDAIYKGFKTKREAESYYEELTGQTPTFYFGNDNSSTKTTTTCVLCHTTLPLKFVTKEFPVRALCAKCKRMVREFPITQLTHGVVRSPLSLNELMYIQDVYKMSDVFAFLRTYPAAAIRARQERHKLPRWAAGAFSMPIRASYPSEYASSSLDTKHIISEHQTLIGIIGSKLHPLVLYHCNRCHQDFVASYGNLKNRCSHQCVADTSAEIAVVREYLQSLAVPLKEQCETLQCINPDTGMVMPYSFELPEQRIIIEVQNKQHRQLVPLFHVDEDGFAYQQQRDAYKRQFAVDNGYQVIEVQSEEIQSLQFQKHIQSALHRYNASEVTK